MFSLVVFAASGALAAQVGLWDKWLLTREKSEALTPAVEITQPVGETEKELPISPDLESSAFCILKCLEERFGPLWINGEVVGYYQGANNATINNQYVRDNSGFGYNLDLELTWNPPKSGQVFLVVIRHGSNSFLDGLKPVGISNVSQARFQMRNGQDI